MRAIERRRTGQGAAARMDGRRGGRKTGYDTPDTVLHGRGGMAGACSGPPSEAQSGQLSPAQLSPLPNGGATSQALRFAVANAMALTPPPASRGGLASWDGGSSDEEDGANPKGKPKGQERRHSFSEFERREASAFPEHLRRAQFTAAGLELDAQLVSSRDFTNPEFVQKLEDALRKHEASGEGARMSMIRQKGRGVPGHHLCERSRLAAPSPALQAPSPVL